MNGRPDGSVSTSVTRATCSLFIFAAALASRRKRSTMPGLSFIAGRSTLMATGSSSRAC